MRILYITSHINPSDGTGSFSRGLICAAGRNGIEPLVLLPAGSGQNRELNEDIALHRMLPSPKKMTVSRLTAGREAFFLARRLRHNPRPALVHCLFERYIPLAWALARRLNTPLVISVIGSYALEPFERRPRGAGIYRTALECASAVAAISEWTAFRLRRHVSNVNCRVLYPGIDTPQSAALNGTMREPIILAVGAVKRRKGHDTLIDAFGRVAHQFPDWRLIIAGATDDSEFMAALRNQIAGTNWGGRVEFRGRVESTELESLYKRAALLALAPRVDGWKFEGYGLVFLEAAAHGLPVICSDQCGFAEEVGRGKFGCSVPAGDAVALADALAAIMSDRAWREDLGRQAAAFARAQSWDVRFRPWLDIYETACRLPQAMKVR